MADDSLRTVVEQKIGEWKRANQWGDKRRAGELEAALAALPSPQIAEEEKGDMSPGNPASPSSEGPPSTPRLMLNRYGRECYSAGVHAGLLAAVDVIEGTTGVDTDTLVVVREAVLQSRRAASGDSQGPRPDFRQGCKCTCCDHGEGSDCACDCHATGDCAFHLGGDSQGPPLPLPLTEQEQGNQVALGSTASGDSTRPPMPRRDPSTIKDDVERALAFVATFKGDDRAGLNCLHSEAIAGEVYRLRSLSLGWQPIETAPKDGSHFIAFGEVADYQPEGLMNVMRWKRNEGAPNGGYFVSRCTIWPERIQWSVMFTPTHWLPLPAPPSDVATDTPSLPELNDHCDELLSALKGVMDMIAADDLIPESVSYMRQARAAIANAEKSSTGAAEAPPLDYRALYHELLFEVARKHPGESRHETARRYIRERETPDPNQLAREALGEVTPESSLPSHKS